MFFKLKRKLKKNEITKYIQYEMQQKEKKELHFYLNFSLDFDLHILNICLFKFYFAND